MKVTVLIGSAVMALLLTGCSQTTADNREADTQALKDNEGHWNQEWAAKDADKIMAHYADDAVPMAPGMDAAVGKDAIRKALDGMLKTPDLSLKFQASKVEIAKSGDAGYTQGAYTLTMTEPASKQPINDHGSYVTTYRKGADGSWKAVADIASSAVPPPAPAKK
jgi:uncharacterized protein (TIGR02246 family)